MADRDPFDLLGPPMGPVATGLSRGELLRAALLAGGGVVTGGVLLGGVPEAADSKASPEQDAEILNFVLTLERLQGAFYAQALSQAKLTGELKEFAEVVGGHEREHTAFVEKALGNAAKPAPRFDFKDATRDARAFTEAALKLEDLGVAAYNAQAPNLTNGTLRAAATIVSVEARHAAWIRDLAGQNPAPEASEPSATAASVTDQLNRTGYVK